MSNLNKKQILFAHSGGGQGAPGQGSFDFVATLRKELSNEYKVQYPIIKDPEAPTYEMWKNLFESVFKKTQEPLILVGHSLGGSMLLKYLSEEKPTISISGLFLISIPHWGELDWEIDDFTLAKNFESNLKHIDKIYLYHCKDDDIVPFQHLDFYKKTLPHAIIKALNGNDHAFTKGLPELVSDIKKL